ncbi:MAG: GNAT family N-acetyltransferase, partial [Spirochaetes bacterium]|nr:GNAT family N-acetyltransferase [Spirochaetota bacterium]
DVMEGPRAVRADELSAVVELSDTVFGEYSPHDMGRWYPTLFCRENLGHLRVFVDDGRPVALAGFTINRVVTPGASFTAACIGSVCTLKSHQGQGLGTRLMHDCVAAALSEAVPVLLVSGGRGLYRRMGCIDAGRYGTVRVPRRAVPSAGVREVREWRLGDVPRMAELHRAEPVRFERSEQEWYAFLRTGRVADSPCRTWVVSAPGRPGDIEAYLCAQETVETPQGRAASVQEIAGSRLAVLAALPPVMDAMRADLADVDSPVSDRGMAAIAAQFGLQVVPRGFHGTVKVIDPPRLLPALRRFVGSGISIEAGADGFVFRLGTESFTVRGLDEVTAFMFGSIEKQAALPGPGPLRLALDTAFPIPLPDYGLNYI